MKKLQFDNYKQVFGYASFRAFWLGYTFSILGDTMTRVALTWLVWQMTKSAWALGWLTFAYTAPVLVGGFLAGWLLDRFGERRVMLIDSLLRSFFVLMIPLLNAWGRLELWHVYGVAAVYGSLFMIPLAGGPTNVGMGALFVWLPIFADEVLGGGAELYGTLLGVLAVGEVLSSVLAGGLMLPFSLGTLICLAQFLAGLSLVLLLPGRPIVWSLLSLALFGLFSAPLTVWAQTLRMQIIPEALRGRTFALLRTLMQGANPLGGLLGGFLLPVLGMPVMIILSVATIAVPGLLGYNVKELRGGGAVPVAQHESI